MAAYPFGGHPTLAAYLTWAAQTAGCKVQSGYKLSRKGPALSTVRITAPSGRYAIVVDMAQNDALVPSSIDYLDRRLGLKSPWQYPGDDGSFHSAK